MVFLSRKLSWGLLNLIEEVAGDVVSVGAVNALDPGGDMLA